MKNKQEIINESSNGFEKEPSHNLKLSEYSESESKNLILGVLLKFRNEKLESKDFKRILFPNDNLEDIKDLLLQIISHNPKIAERKKSREYKVVIYSNENTKSFLEKDGFVGFEKSEKLRMENKSINNNTTNNNYGGTFIQDSRLENSPIKNKVKTEPNINPEQKSLVKKIFSSSWTLLFVGILVEEITLGKIWEYIRIFI